MTRAAEIILTPAGLRVAAGLALAGGMAAARVAEAPALLGVLAAGLVLLAAEFVTPPRARPLLLAAGAFALPAAAAAPDLVARAVPALLPAIGFGTAAWWFGRSLLPGREPLIVRWNRHNAARDAAASARYARRLTGIWAAALALMAAAGLAAVPPGGPDPGIVAAVNQSLIVLLFLGEHVVRGFVVRDVPWPSDTIRAVWRAEWTHRGR